MGFGIIGIEANSAALVPFQTRFGRGFRVDSLRFVDFRELILASFLCIFVKRLGGRAFRDFRAEDAAMLGSGIGRNGMIGLNMRSRAIVAATGPARPTPGRRCSCVETDDRERCCNDEQSPRFMGFHGMAACLESFGMSRRGAERSCGRQEAYDPVGTMQVGKECRSQLASRSIGFGEALL